MMNHTFDDGDFTQITEYITDMAADQAYLMLVEHGPAAFDPDFPHIKLIDSLIKHFASKEAYEQCAVLVDLQAEVAVDKLIRPNQEKTS